MVTKFEVDTYTKDKVANISKFYILFAILA